MASLTCFGNVDSSKAIKNLIALIVGVSRPPHNISVCIGPPVNILFSVEYNWGIQLISLATDRFCRPSLDDDAVCELTFCIIHTTTIASACKLRLLNAVV